MAAALILVRVALQAERQLRQALSRQLRAYRLQAVAVGPVPVPEPRSREQMHITGAAAGVAEHAQVGHHQVVEVMEVLVSP